MIIRFVCWLFGHHTMLKACTGNEIDGFILYKWERHRYCVRCGKEVWKP